MQEIQYYADEEGRKPVQEFIDALDCKMQAKVFGRLELLEEYGPMLGMPLAKHLDDGIFELRTVQDCDFKREWDAQADERQVMRKIVEARMAEGMTQVELAEACGMKPANLCRLENGNGNPSVATLSKIAHGLGRRLEISFV